MTVEILARRRLLAGGLVAIAVALAGCERKVELLGRLSETDANAALRVLREHGISAVKTVRKEGIALEVSSGDTVAALSALNAYGLPRGANTSMGEVFRREGMVSTPLEERARYVHALSKELESIIEQIDGVVVARVLVVLPERAAPGALTQPPSASVFVKHRDEFDPDLIRPQIARMVGAAVPGLADGWREHVTVVFVRAAETLASASTLRRPAPADGSGTQAWLVPAAGALSTVGIAGAAVAWRRRGARAEGPSVRPDRSPT